MNTYSFRVDSTKMTILSITQSEFIKKYRRMLNPLSRYFQSRQEFADEIVQEYLKNSIIIKDEFYSTIEKGNINIYLMKDLKANLEHANRSMKKKLHKHYLKKDMELNGVIKPFTED